MVEVVKSAAAVLVLVIAAVRSLWFFALVGFAVKVAMAMARSDCSDTVAVSTCWRAFSRRSLSRRSTPLSWSETHSRRPETAGNP